MKILSDDEYGIASALAVLAEGGVVAHATETCYGLACDMSNADAVEKLFAIKQRPGDMPVSALFASVDQAKEYCEWNEKAEELAKEHLPGPLTIILPMIATGSTTLHVAPNPNPNAEPQTVGIRISSNPTAQSLVEQFGKPVSTTSANLHGQPNPYSAAEIVSQLESQDVQPDLILDSGTLPQVEPSTVVSVLGEELIIVRQGDQQLME